MTTLRTDRLVLRPWRGSDREPWAALNADPVVMEHFPSVLDRDASDALAARIALAIEERGWGLWAVEVAGDAPFIGFVGAQPVPFEAHFTPAVEIGWRLARAAWGHGYAIEGARAVVAHCFDALHLEEIVAMTTPANRRSQQVMERLGMHRDPADDFDHPRLPDGHAIQRHVLYRLRRDAWMPHP